jgi:hypothetical protein
MPKTTPADEAMGVIAITFEDEEEENDETVGLDITLPLAQAEDWAASHEKELKEAEITVQPADKTEAASPSEHSVQP